MILVIVNTERNPRTGGLEQVVSHGIDLDSYDDRIIVLPNVPPESIGAVFDGKIGEYFLLDSLRR